MKIILFTFIALVILLTLTIIIGKIINTQKYKIRSETSVQKSTFVPIGGIEQYLQIRGQDRANPVILVLHGGPGSNMAYYSYGWQAALEQTYTIVHWDQRGCGNTYYRNQAAEKPTLDLLLSDLDELVDYIRSDFNQEKIILMGHSWGTFLGAIYSGEHPEKTAAYLSVSQMLDFRKSEQVSAQEAIRLADFTGRAQDAQKINEMLENILVCQKFGLPEATVFLKLRQLKEKYLPPQYSGRMGSLRLFSPYMTFSDLKWMVSFKRLIETNSALYSALLSEGQVSLYDRTLKYKIPVIMVAGNLDWTTPYSMTADYCNAVSAPAKELITIENTGHIPFADRPEEFSEAVLKALGRVL